VAQTTGNWNANADGDTDCNCDCDLDSDIYSDSHCDNNTKADADTAA
jgi:hypothetical protein